MGNYWFDKMTEIQFNFEGKTDNWTKKFDKIKSILDGRKTISIDEIGLNEYVWIQRHRKDLEEGKLIEYKSNKIQELELDRFFETWEQIFEKVKDWIENNGRTPTKHSNKDLNSWLYSQRSRYKNGTLNESQIEQLNSIGFDLEGKGNENKRDRWLEMYGNLVAFRKDNPGSWPKSGADGLEGKLYNWCQANRQAQAGTHSGGRRKSLKQWKVDKLNEFGFHWSLKERNRDSWDNNLNELKKYIDKNFNLIIPQKIGEDYNPLYTWWMNQKKAIQDGKMKEEKLNRLKKLKVDLALRGRDGFSKWANKARDIAEFISEKGHYPKAGKDNTQSNLYQSLARTKRAFNNNELSEEQLKLLNELNIEL